MTPGDMTRVLAKCAAFDQRTVGEADVLAWFEAVGHLNYDDAMAAVARHYSQTRDRMMPVDLANGVLAIRNDRAAKQQHEIRSLPSRFEYDPERNTRIAENIRKLAQGWSVPTADQPDDPRTLALERARRERRGQQIPQPRRRGEGKPVDLAKVASGPDWASDASREREAVRALHRAKRRCGRSACATCNPDDEP